MRILPAEAAIPCVLKLKMALEYVQFLKFCPFFGKLFFFQKLYLLIVSLIVH